MLLPNQLFFQQVERTLAAGQRVQIRMKGHSMRPLLRDDRDLVVLEPCVPDTLRTGDIVLFRCKGRHILHRIRRIVADDPPTNPSAELQGAASSAAPRHVIRFELAGDGNYRIHECCTANDVVARAMQVVRPSGRVVACDSARWRFQSCVWLALPEWLRRQLLRIVWRLGVC